MSAAYNISGVSRSGAGNYVITFSPSSFASAAYICVGSIEDGATNGIVKTTAAGKATNAVQLFVVNFAGTTYDADNVDVVCFGTN